MRNKQKLIQPDRQRRHVHCSGKGDLGIRRGGGPLQRTLSLVPAMLVLTGLLPGMVTEMLDGAARRGLHPDHAGMNRGRALAKQHHGPSGARDPNALQIS